MAEDNKYNIKIECGADFVLPFTWYDNNGVPYDLTDATVTAQLRESPSSPDAYDFICHHDGEGGRITLTMLDEVTSQLPFSYGVYDVYVDLPTGRVRPLYGDVTIQDHVTKPLDGEALYMIGVSTYEDLPENGIMNRLYFCYDDRKIYRWNGTNYIATAVGNGIQSIEYVDGGTYRMVFDDGTYFDFESVPRLMGQHDSTLEYQKLDVVHGSNGATYIALVPVPADTLITDTDYWMQITPKTLTIGTVTDVASDAGAEVTQSGTADAPVLNFKIPRGVSGSVLSENIKDDAGLGDTDRVWSADRTYRVTHDKYRTTTGGFVFENGYINSSGGNSSTNAEKRGRSQTYVVFDDEITYLKVTPDTGIWWLGRIYKRSDNSFVGSIPASGNWIETSQIVYLDPEYKYRFCIRKEDDSEFDATLLPANTLTYVAYHSTDTSLTLSGKPADAKTTGGKIESLNKQNLIWNTSYPIATSEAKRPLVNGHRKIAFGSSGVKHIFTAVNHGVRVTSTIDGKTLMLKFGYNQPQIRAASHVPLDGLNPGGTYTLAFDATIKYAIATNLNLYYYEKSEEYKDTNTWNLYNGSYVRIMEYTEDDIGTEKTVHFEWTHTFDEDAFGYAWQITTTTASRPYSEAGNFIQIDNIILVEGEYAPAWKPSPYDYIESEIPDIIGYNGAEMELKLQQLNRRTRLSGSSFGTKPFCLLHFSDIHGDSQCLRNIVSYKNYYSKYLDDTICTGDMVAQRASDGMTFWDSVGDEDEEVGAKDILTCIGNHDTRDDGSLWISQTMQESYDLYIAPYIENWGDVVCEEDTTYYYKDYPTKKVRLIVLDGMHQSADQLQWFRDTLSNAKLNGYHVICAAHIKPHWQTTRYESNWDDAPLLPEGSNYRDQTYTDNSGNTGTNYPTNFATSYCDAIVEFIQSGGYFVCWINGHTHYKMFCHVTPAQYSDILIISVANAGFAHANNYIWERVANSKSADDFNCLAIDTQDKILRIAKVGVDYDRHLRHIDTISYNYATRTLLYNN